MHDRPDVINDLVQIFTRADQPVEVQECVTALLEKSSKDQGEQAALSQKLFTTNTLAIVRK